MEQNKLIAFDSLYTMLQALPDDTICREYLESVRWSGKPTCPHCGFQEHYELKTKGEFKGMYKCKNCRERYTVTIGTMFEGSHIPLRKWFIGIYIFSLHKKGISSHQLASDLGITQKSAWFMLSRIRKAFEPKHPGKTDGLFQADEYFAGGKNKNRHEDKKIEGTQGRSTKDKTPILGISKTGGNVHTFVIPDTTAATLKPLVESMVKKGGIVVTDDWDAYNGLDKDYGHVVLNHTAKEYVRGGFTTNNIENFWSLLSRGIFGIYHHVSPKHLQKYCDEFAFRYNARKQDTNTKFDYSLKNSKKITYKALISK
jgi:transposase-like protein